MTEVNGARKVEQLQAQIKELRKPENGGVEKNRAKIEELNRQIQEAITGKVDSSMVGLELERTESGKTVVTGADSHTATTADIEDQRKYQDPAYVKEHLAKPTMTPEAFKELENDIKEKEKELKELRKQLTKAHGEARGPIQDKIEALVLGDSQKGVKGLKELQEQYKSEKILQDAYYNGKGIKGITKAGKNNEKNMTNVYTIQEVYGPGDAEKTRMEADITSKEDGGEGKYTKDQVKQLSQKEFDTLQDLAYLGKRAITKAREKFEAGQMDEADFKQIEERYTKYTQMFKEDGSIDAKVVQDVLVDYSGFDHNFNFDETKQLAKQLDAKKGAVNGMVKKFGFGVENGTARRLLNAGAITGAALLGNIVNGIINSKSAHAYQRADIPEQSFQVFDGLNEKQLEYINEMGEKVIKTQAEAMTHTVTTGGGYVEAAADCAVNMLKGVPGLGTLLGPVAAGLTAFLLYQPTTENAFNDMKVADALLPQNLDNVKGDDNRLLMKKIQDIELTGNAAADLRIKTAILNQAIGEFTTNANTEELLAGLTAIEKFKETIQNIEVPDNPEPTVNTVPTKPDLDVINEPTTEQVRVELPRMKLREGTWYTSHGYVNEDGSNLTEAERKMVQKALNEEANRIGGVDTNGDGKFDWRDKKVSLPTEITLPNGKKVKIASDAYDRIMKLPAKGGGTGANPAYANATITRINNQYYVIEKGKPDKKLAGPFKTEAEAIAAKQKLQEDAE